MIAQFERFSAFSYSQARRYQRFPVQFPVKLASTEYRLSDTVRDFSEGGVGVQTQSPLPVMTLVELELELPHEDRPAKVMGRVMWSGPDTMGIRFEGMDPTVLRAADRMAKNFQRI